MKHWFKFEMSLPLKENNDKNIEDLLKQHYANIGDFTINYFSDGTAELVVELFILYTDITKTQKEIIRILKENNYLCLDNIKEQIDYDYLMSYVYPLEVESIDNLNQDDFKELFKEELGEDL